MATRTLNGPVPAGFGKTAAESTDEAGGTTEAPAETTAPPATATSESESTTTTAAVADGPFTVIEAANGTVEITARPEAIVSLSPTATEMLFAIGAGDQVVAVDEFSYYPEEAPVTELSGFTPNLEAIGAYAPDLVVVANDLDGIVGALEAVGVPVLLLPAAAEFAGTSVTVSSMYHSPSRSDLRMAFGCVRSMSPTS